MRYIDLHFTSLRVVHCHLASGEDGRHGYHNWEIPRLAASMLAGGRIEEIRWFWKGQIDCYHRVPLEEVLRSAVTLFEIPRVEERDGKMGFEYRRLVCAEGRLGEGREVYRWAMECRGRKRHELDVRRLEDCLVFRRKN